MAFAANVKPSILALDSGSDNWITSPELTQPALQCEPEIFRSVAAHLIANPNVHTSHLFRADILHDSAGVLKTRQDREDELLRGGICSQAGGDVIALGLPAKHFPGFELRRTVIRRFIPRNPKLDRPLEQTCHFYDNNNPEGTTEDRHLVVYTPHVSTEDELPWYHPAVRSLAFLYVVSSKMKTPSEGETRCGILSLHFLPFSPGIPREISTRVERTLLALLSVQLRLMRGTVQDPSKTTPYKDNVIPQHTTQDTYMRLKEKYAPSLIANWVEDTEPLKHVFEDLGIAAFLIELWKLMYDVRLLNGGKQEEDNSSNNTYKRPFVGFVDMACGNGVLVHILLSEGYPGWGFDARHRKTWSIFPQSTQDQLKETICIPGPFQDVLAADDDNDNAGSIDPSVTTHTGIFEDDTFIISNHADELTVWTPLLGVLSNPARPLPFLAIPCCSHSLSGARYRYPRPKKHNHAAQAQAQHGVADQEQNPQPASGDLRALRAAKQRALQNPDDVGSTYGCLTAKVVSVAREVGYDAERTMLRIPSTRNMGVIGGLGARNRRARSDVTMDEAEEGMSLLGEGGVTLERVQQVLDRETLRDGGMEEAAKVWVERALGLQKSKGRGKLKGGAQHS